MQLWDTTKSITAYRNRRRAMYEPPERLLVPEWAEKHIFISEQESEDFPGSYRIQNSPYCRGPMEAFTDPLVKFTVFVTCSQAGKTLNVVIIPIAYRIDQDPCSIMLALPTLPNAREFCRDRLQPVFDNSPRICKHKPRNANWYNLSSMKFDRCNMYLTGSNSDANLASKPIGLFVGDEIDKFPPASSRESDALYLGLQRIKAKRRGRAVLTSTPSTVKGNIWQWWLKGDMRHLLFPCPHCGHMQKAIMGAREEYQYFEGVVLPPRGGKHSDKYRLKWPKDCAISDLDHRAWLECENPECIGKIYDPQLKAALKKAKWKSFADSRNIAGFHLNAFGVLWESVPLGEIAHQFLVSKKSPDGLKGFFQNWLALPWDAVERGDDAVQISNVGKDVKVGYKLNQCPPGIVFLTAGIDVQAHEIYYVIRGWGAAGLSALISFGKVKVEVTDREELIAACRGVMEQDYGQPIILGGIDSGWGRHTSEVYDIARNVKRLVCTKGRRDNVTKHTAGSDIPIPPPRRLDKSLKGGKNQKGPLLYSPSTVYWKRFFFARVNSKESNWKWPNGLKISKDGKTYLRHLESEKEVEIETNTANMKRKQKAFVTREGYDDNHWLDCEIIACVVMEISLTIAEGGRIDLDHMGPELLKIIEERKKAKTENAQNMPKAGRKRRPPVDHT